MKIMGILFLFAWMQGSLAHADLMTDFDSLGGNQAIYQKAKDLEPDQKVEIVQNRVVDLSKRSEISPQYSRVLGGNTYVQTQALDLSYQFHFTPRWSAGVKGSYYFNELTKEGRALIDADATPEYVPEVDHAKYQWMVEGNWYPIYGKMNVLDLGIAHYDIYALLGAGQVTLKSGATPTYEAGIGFAVWLSQHLTSRLEVRYQTYNSQSLKGSTQNNLTETSLSMGYLL